MMVFKITLPFEMILPSHSVCWCHQQLGNTHEPLYWSSACQLADNCYCWALLTVPALYHPAVHCVVLTSQQICRVGFGQCCSQAGIPLPRDAVCDNSSDPCTFAARCNGNDITCPSRQKAADGTVCSFKPYGVFLQTSSHRRGYAATRDPHAAVSAAAHSVYHPRTNRRCYKGQCARVIVIEDRKGAKQHSGSHRNHRPTSSKVDSQGRLF